MTELNDILNSFESLTLEELNNVRLLDRMDTKYIFHIRHLPSVLQDLKPDFLVLDIGGIRNNRYQTIYFDTPGLAMYLNHHNKRLNRYKVRLRQYGDSGINFLETKFKNNKKRTIKTRIRRDEFLTDFDEKAMTFIRKTPYPPETLSPVLKVCYSRMTFVSRTSPIRLTIDTGLHYSFNGQENQFSNLVIAEIKQNRTVRSDFHTLMRKYHIPALSISKYCLGIISLYQGVKKNNFKRKLLTIQHLLSHDH